MAKTKKTATAAQSAAVAKITKGENGLQIVDLESGGSIDLKEAKEAPLDLVGSYWTPEQTGETKRVLFSHIALSKFKDQNSDEEVELETVFMYENVNGNMVCITNASKRLVGAMQNANIQKGTPLQITWVGKKKNKSNSFMSDNWSIKPLIIQVNAE